MSCEKLKADLEIRRSELELTLERAKVGHFIQRLSISCRDGRSRKTHTSGILNSEEDAQLDKIWAEIKPEAEEYLRNIEPLI
ncbi:hypothetical protein A3J17_03185 [Candidatus Curtissbacteria bacterium RIFCSPLOWO2_02_FULL_40_11]|uniref:Uncharacterized protein n=2 Tax=Candidatus Curtissiibacteriota TaxID=1752717 RepID=A0A1F5G6T2_9BACT|nr:MAG: hypothetical protein A3D04_04605 [Candidatus Curtissbacteria bacterium RIFCSPHIGHO2_02_FULL_40_16b]OGE00907.1 MAG: hypothetical protein A3J17_03185 [Candidatus Curtissbacteria bacterium RIFCSPLOWO2_02_FULL_40_11]OGE14230.1 MAG: hypothetical protein A3G14_04270 [Candidatus Curtissbacteria bacterium RIFCSPLOWO2_12_FULL_38_9]